MNAGNGQPYCHVCGHQHVQHLRAGRRVQHGCDRIHVDNLPVDSAKPGWRVHPRIRRDDEHARERAACGNEDTGAQMHAAADPVPPVQINAEEDRLEEEREPLQREGKGDNRARERHEARPQQAELERQDGP